MWGSIIAGGGALLGGLLGGKGASDAADAQQQAAEQSLALQKWIFQQQKKLQKPFREAGLTAQNRLMLMLGMKGSDQNPLYGKYAGDFGMEDFEADPGYQFRLSEGLKSLDRQAASRGGLISGAALKAAQRYGQDAASQEYTNAFNRYQVNRSNQLNPLFSFTGAGQQSTGQVANAAQNYGVGAGQAYGDIGNSRASGYVGQANALNNALSGMSNAYWMNRAYPTGQTGYGIPGTTQDNGQPWGP